jgi:hypothetical protein
MRTRRFGLSVLVVVVCAGLVASPVLADTSVTSSTTYNGTDGNSQRITVSLSVTADVVTNNVSMLVRPTSNTHIEYDSFERTQPGGISIERVSPGRYRLDEIEPGEEVTFEFVAYPETLTEENLDVAVVDFESQQNPDGGSHTVAANMSTSPRLALDSAQNEITSLRSQTSQMELGFYGGIAIGIVGFLIAGVLFYRSKQMVPKSDVCSDLSTIKDRLGRSNAEMVDRYLDEYGCETDDGGPITGSPGGGVSADSDDTDSTPDTGETDRDDDGPGPIA